MRPSAEPVASNELWLVMGWRGLDWWCVCWRATREDAGAVVQALELDAVQQLTNGAISRCDRFIVCRVPDEIDIAGPPPRATTYDDVMANINRMDDAAANIAVLTGHRYVDVDLKLDERTAALIAERERLPRQTYDRGRRVRARVSIEPVDNGRTLTLGADEERRRRMRDVFAPDRDPPKRTR